MTKTPDIVLGDAWLEGKHSAAFEVGLLGRERVNAEQENGHLRSRWRQCDQGHSMRCGGAGPAWRDLAYGLPVITPLNRQSSVNKPTGSMPLCSGLARWAANGGF